MRVQGDDYLTTAIGFLFGLIVTAVAWFSMRALLATPIFRRVNYRGREVATAGGLLIIPSLLAMELALTLSDQMAEHSLARRTGVVIGVVFGCLGLIDDLWGDSSAQGFRGHLRAMVSGTLTTGGLKLLGGGIAGLGAGWTLYGNALDAVVVGSLVALTANLTNLLDRAPGRSTKVTLALCPVVFAMAASFADLLFLAVVAGSAVALLVPELGETVMLGDTGSNILGASLAVAIGASASREEALAFLVVVLALNLTSEKVSFSEVIQRSSVLRFLDMAGRRP